MCLAVPGKIVGIKNGTATVDYEIEIREGRIIDKCCKIGDYVIIQGKFVIQKVKRKEAVEALELYKKSME